VRAVCIKVSGMDVNMADDLFRRLEQLNDIGAALSKERDHQPPAGNHTHSQAKTITHADGGYAVSADRRSPALRFEIMRTDSLNNPFGRYHGNKITFPILP